MHKAPNEHVRVSIWVWFLAATLILTVFLPRIDYARAAENIGVDLFTQKAHFDGRGLNQSSDVFGPQEQVILYAQVLYCNLPLETLVAYEIDGPLNRSSELRFYQTAMTNSSGIAQTVFSLASINESDSFGTWVASVTVEINGMIYADRLSFEVNWLVEVLSVRTLNENLSDQRFFGIDGFVGFEVVWRNNAMTKKTAILKVTVRDELSVVVANSTLIRDLVVPPNRRTQYVFGKLLLAKAVPGNATIMVAATDYEGAAYSPQVATDFWITADNPVFPNFMDAFVYVESMPIKPQAGQELTITVLVRNEGTFVLNNIQVQTFVDSNRTDVRNITSLEPYRSQTFNITLNTQGYQDKINITSMIQTFPGEADLTDNSYLYIVELETVKPQVVHDIEVMKVVCSKNEVISGEIVDILVIIKNNGNVPESSSVRALYDETLIQQIHFSELEPEKEVNLTFHWNTTGIPEGAYDITAMAEPVLCEANTGDNIYHDGTVTVIGPAREVIDVAVVAVSASPNVSENNVPVQIIATVQNLGLTVQSFNVEFRYDESLVATVNVSSLSPGTMQNLRVTWDICSVIEGNYTISVFIPPLYGEENTANNLCVDGTVWIQRPLLLQLSIFIGIVLTLILLASVFLLLLLYYSGRQRRRKRKALSSYTMVARPHI